MFTSTAVKQGIYTEENFPLLFHNLRFTFIHRRSSTPICCSLATFEWILSPYNFYLTKNILPPRNSYLITPKLQHALDRREMDTKFWSRNP